MIISSPIRFTSFIFIFDYLLAFLCLGLGGFLLFSFLRFFKPDFKDESIDLSSVHTDDGIFSLLFGIIIDNGIIFESSKSTGVYLSKMGEDLIDMVLSNIGTKILYNDRYEFNTIFRRIRIR